MGKYKYSEEEQKMNNVLKYQDDQLKELLAESRSTRNETDAEIEAMETFLRKRGLDPSKAAKKSTVVEAPKKVMVLPSWENLCAEAESVVGGSLSETKPADWKYVTTIHYLASGMGSTIYNHMWGADASATGAGVGKEWPGGQISENADHSGWYDVVYTQDVKQNFSCIFNNNNGTQTDNIDVSVTSTSTELWVTGTKAGGDTTVYKTAPDSWEAPVPDHTFTIYYYNEDLSTDTDLGKVDMWMWNAGLNGSYVFDGTYYDAENDVTWFKKTITVAGSNVEKTVGLKARYDITQGWDGGSDTADRSFTISGDENEVLYYVDGSDPVHEKPVIKQTEKRYLVLDYENPGLQEKGITPHFYTWTSGYASVLTNFTYVGGDKWTVTIPAKPSCTKVDFCIALDSTGDPWIKDGGDHSVTFPSDQKVIYASMKAGSEPEIAMPYNTGYEVDAEKQQVSYYYRDDAAFVDGTLKDMTVSVDVNGTEYPMTYNDTTKPLPVKYSAISSNLSIWSIIPCAICITPTGFLYTSLSGYHITAWILHIPLEDLNCLSSRSFGIFKTSFYLIFLFNIAISYTDLYYQYYYLLLIITKVLLIMINPCGFCQHIPS